MPTQIRRGCLGIVAFIGAIVLVACGSSQPNALPNNADGQQEPATPDVTVTSQTGSDASPTEPSGATSTVIPPSPLPTPTDNTGPRFDRITTSGKVFAKSDCTPTSITVTAHITDPSGVVNVVLWYRVGANQPFTPVDVDDLGNDTYAQTVKGMDVPGKYGVWEFYLTAEDGLGNKGQSPVDDTSVQLLPCVAH
jgi:hypothetical protein